MAVLTAVPSSLQALCPVAVAGCLLLLGVVVLLPEVERWVDSLPGHRGIGLHLLCARVSAPNLSAVAAKNPLVHGEVR